MIKHAAIRQDGIVYVGKRHPDCIRIMVDCGLPTPITGEQGFVTDEGKFVSRERAYFIASTKGQIKRKPHKVGVLFSEDIY